MKYGIFFGSMFGIIAANFIYQAWRDTPDWAIASERSWFQFVALAGLGISWAVASINHQL